MSFWVREETGLGADLERLKAITGASKAKLIRHAVRRLVLSTETQQEWIESVEWLAQEELRDLRTAAEEDEEE